MWTTRESTTRSVRSEGGTAEPAGPVDAAAGPSGSVIVGREGGSGCGGDAFRDERGARFGVEQVQLRERQVELEDVARLDVVLRPDDADDVLLGRRDVEQLLVAQVLDDVRAPAERARRLGDVRELEMLGAE